MSNEWLALVHCFISILFLSFAIRIGKKAVIVFVSASWLLANLFVSQQIVLYGYEATASDVYTIGAMFGESILQELWGRKTVEHTIRITFFCLFFAVCMSLLHQIYTPSSHDVATPHIVALFQQTPRLFLASATTFLIAARCEIIIFQFIRKVFTAPFVIRSLITASIVACIDTCLFSFLGLYGNVYSIRDVCFISCSVKLILIWTSSPFLSLIKNYS